MPATYERVRPNYPAEFFDQLFAELGPDPSVLEVGPGTGQATADLLARGARVVAAEIGPNLASFLRSKFADQTRLEVRNQAFEEVPPEAGPFDTVFSACAYHWIQEGLRVTHPHRFLKPGGLLAIIELTHVAAASDRGYFDRVQPIYESFGDGRHDWEPPTHETAIPFILDDLERSPLFADVRVDRVVWDQTYTSAQYRDLLLSYSGTQMMHEPDRSSLVDQLVAVVDDEYGGVVTRPLVAMLTTAQAVE